MVRPTLTALGKGRAKERGAAIFIVVLVLTMLSAVGVFAMRAASLSQATAGYDRQNTQNHYVAEFGMLGAVTELSTNARDAYFKQMTKVDGGDTCYVTQWQVGQTADTTCYHMYAQDIQKTVNQTAGSPPLFAPAQPDGGVVIPGSLGPTPLVADFNVELSEPGPVGRFVPGTDVGGTGGTANFSYRQVTLTGTGLVQPPTVAGTCADNVAANSVAGMEQARAFIVIGPIPGK